MRCDGFKGGLVLLKEINGDVICIEQVEGTLGDLIQSRKYFTRRCNMICDICQGLDNPGAPALFLEEACIFNGGGGLISEGHCCITYLLVKGSRFQAIQSNCSNHLSAGNERHNHPSPHHR